MRQMIYYLTIAAFAFSPIYLWRSGLPQISHITMGLAMILMLIFGKWKKTKPGIIAFIFAIWAFIINCIFYLLYYDLHFLFSGLYYLFNAAVWTHFVSICFQRRNFLLVIWRILWITLLLEGLLVFLGIGRIYLGMRSQGTFNDPNQLSHWTVWVVVLIASLGWYLHRKWLYGFVALIYASGILLFSASRSGFLGLFTIWLVFVLMAIEMVIKYMLQGRLPIKRLYLALFAFAFVCVLGIAVLSWKEEVSGTIYSRIMERYAFFLQRWQREAQNPNLFWEERGYVRLWKFPEYLFFGSGEGAHDRWGGIPVEIHSTFAGVLFYYGLPGFVLLLIFLYQIWRTQSQVWLRLMYFAPLILSLGTYNLRNNFFWIGYATFYVLAISLSKKRNDTNGSLAKGSSKEV